MSINFTYDGKLRRPTVIGKKKDFKILKINALEMRRMQVNKHNCKVAYLEKLVTQIQRNNRLYEQVYRKVLECITK